VAAFAGDQFPWKVGVYRHVTMPLVFALASGKYDRVGLSTRTKQDSPLPSGESFLEPHSTDENTFLQTSSFRGVHTVRSTDNTNKCTFHGAQPSRHPAG
jgi:hypothetical protein